MEEVINFKKSILQNSFISFFDGFKIKGIEEQILFINALRILNLDIFFFQVLKKYNLTKGLDNKIIAPIKKEFLLEKGRDHFYKIQFQKILLKSKFPILLMKGWQLRDVIGIDLYKRSCDVDLMVLEKDYHSTINMLKTEFDFFLKPEYIAYGQSCLLNENSMCVDLHKKLIAMQAYDTVFKLSAKSLFNETVSKKDSDAQYLVFNSEMEFIHLCIHFLIHHKGFGFLLIYELKEFISKNYSDFDVTRIIEVSNRHKVMPIILFTLKAIQELCVLSLEENKWYEQIITKENDSHRDALTLFSKSFTSEGFYKDKAISDKIIKKLCIRGNKNEFKHFISDTGFKFYCFFKSLGQTLKLYD